MGANDTVLEMVKAEAFNRAKMEGVTRRMIKDVAEQFNEVHHADVKRFDEMAKAINSLAEQQNQNAVMMGVLLDVVLNPELAGCTQEKFNALCATRAKAAKK